MDLIYIYIHIRYVCVLICIHLFIYSYLSVCVRRYTHTREIHAQVYNKSTSGLLQKLVVQRHNGLGIGCHCLRCGGWDLLMKLTLRIANLKGKVVTNPFLLIKTGVHLRFQKISDCQFDFYLIPFRKQFKNQATICGFSPLILKTSQPRGVYY